MTTAVTAISPEEMAAELDSGAPSSQLIDIREYLIRANPTKRTIALEHERVTRSLKTVFIGSYRTVNDREARQLYKNKTKLFRDEIRSQMKNVTRELQKLTNKWEIELDNLGVEPSDTFSNPTLLKVNITSPEEAQFWEIIQSMDWLLIVMENLWHYRKLEMENKQDVVHSITRQIYSIGRNLENRAGSIRGMNATIRKNENQESELEEDKTTDLQADILKIAPETTPENIKAAQAITA